MALAEMFHPPQAVLAGFGAGFSLVLFLLLYSRGPFKVSALGGRYVRAALSASVVLGLLLLALWAGPDGLPWQGAFAGICIFVTAVLLLEVFWGVLTFGFTLNLLAALTRHGGQVSLDEWAMLFGGEAGVEGISCNRLEILVKLRMVEIQNGSVRLTAPRGMLMALTARFTMGYFAIDRRWR